MEDQSVRIQPPDLCIPEEDPFGTDHLGRKESVEVLTRIVSRIEGPCVLALDAPWGYGKTTFLKMWEGWLRQEAQGFPVVACFNAWETDFTNHPFLALSSELTKELESCIETAPIPGFNTFKRAGKKLLQIAPQLAGSLVPGGGATVEAVLSVLSTAVSDRVDTNDYLETKEAIAEFKAALGELARGLDKPLVIMIDELDRCRPSYAVELLEVAKHLFAVNNIVFVLAVNRAELVHSVKGMYGPGFCAEGYLHRFFDLDFQLPKPGRQQFVDALLNTTGLASILESQGLDEPDYAMRFLKAFLASPELSLREVQQATHRLALTMKLLPDGTPLLPIAAVVGVALRTANFEVYQQFVNMEATDGAVADAVFGLHGTGPTRSKDLGAQIETHIIMMFLARNQQDLGLDFANVDSPLLARYREAAAKSDDTWYADQILERVQVRWEHIIREFPRQLLELGETIVRLELLAPQLGEEWSV